MSRQVRTLIVLSVAIVAAALASFGVYRAVSQLPQRGTQIALKKAVVAATAMPVGTLVTRESVKLIDWPANSPLEGGFSKIEDVIDRGLVTPVVENEPLSENKLAPKEAGAGLPPTIKQGMRAISVRVNEVIGVAGFVVPGTHVDVVTIIKDPTSTGKQDDTLSRVVVSNVQVLTAGTRYDQEESKKDGKPIRSTVVTLMVNPLDAERIALAQSQGELLLTLRHPLDVEPTADGPGIRKAALFGPVEAPKPAPAPSGKARAPRPPVPAVVPVVEPVPIRKPYLVETIRAAKRSEDKLADIIAVP
jgi:pilus assembly protein CpaB